MAILKSKPVRDSRTQLSDLILPSDSNPNGTVFGGKILEMVDKAAAVCAMRHSSSPCVTVAMERVEFLVPIKVGHLLAVEARVNFAGKTSMEIGVEVYSEDMTRGSRIHANSCLVTMVAVDARGKPRPVPRLIAETPMEKENYAAAQRRRHARLGRPAHV